MTTKLEDLMIEADNILRGTDDDLLDNGELKITIVSENEFTGEKLATIRGASGLPVIYPHPEAQTILVSKQPYFDLLVKGPRIIRALVDIAENRENQAKSAKNPAESA